jgi:hypothetical protein
VLQYSKESNLLVLMVYKTQTAQASSMAVEAKPEQQNAELQPQ